MSWDTGKHNIQWLTTTLHSVTIDWHDWAVNTVTGQAIIINVMCYN